ncbi:hypothetical protein MTR_4g037380 [Medicago truncatula]|uniref:Transmembrane protein n=1 Tax=Medicago truncatula TaxID=3880 RepID=G7JSG5_MEDTR|nr:hypothetical protein MTR_4g037380 [Medicago truncatula]
MHFKFNQAWISAGLLLLGLQPPREARPPCCILREGGGLPLLKSMRSEQRECFDGYDAPVCERSCREYLHSCFLQLRIQELKGGREYMVIVFNGFINA